jgi:hypothetical protein
MHTPLPLARGNAAKRRIGSSAAGALALTAGVMPAHAAIVYSGILNKAVSPASPFNLDINNDNIAEYRYSAVAGQNDAVTVTALESSANWIRYAPNGNPSLLAQDDLIGASANYTSSLSTGTISSDSGSGKWLSPFPTDGFMGVRFDLAGSTHYGWIEITVNSTSTAVINSWAYESVAGTVIGAGDTGATIPLPSTSALMLGALAAAMLVRRARLR